MINLQWIVHRIIDTKYNNEWYQMNNKENRTCCDCQSSESKDSRKVHRDLACVVSTFHKFLMKPNLPGIAFLQIVD